MAWTPRTTAAAVVVATGLVNLAIVYVVGRYLFGGSTLVYGVGIAVVALGSVGGYRSMVRKLARRAEGHED